jgi:hypothetical protein
VGIITMGVSHVDGKLGAWQAASKSKFGSMASNSLYVL